ncbi:hypothetical protein OAO21_01060 [Alphaproteobacteria bacterium]|nr:hypothetical protein [Alphaproteobacteria bacterium]
MKKLIITLFFFLTLNACQPIEKVNHVVFDNSQFAHFNILSTSVDINVIFEKKISDPYIGHTLKVNPSERIINWINDNFKPIGNENIFNVAILDASITQAKFENQDAKNFDEKNNYIYELSYLLEFSLFDDSGSLVASTLVETSRSTTSGIYISIQEKDNIIDDLIYNSLVDVSNESKKLLINYMANYLL